MKKLIFALSFLTAILFSRGALAQTPYSPARCSYGNQDSSCTTPLYTEWQTAPACPTDPGWATVVPAKWIGSKYSQPQCTYVAPPTCPSGQVQTVAPVWNGSSWVGLACNPPPGGDPSNIAAMCSSQIPSGYYPSSSWSQDTDPDIRHMDDYVASYSGVSGYSSVYSLNADGPTYSLPCYDRNNYRGRCYVGSSNSVVALILSQASSASSGQCNH